MLYAVEKKGKVQIRVGVQFVVISHPDKDDVWQFNMPNTGLPPIYRVSAGWVLGGGDKRGWDCYNVISPGSVVSCELRQRS